MMVVASVDQATKRHTQGWRGHRKEGICMPLPTAVETSMLALCHTLWTVIGDRTQSVSGSICPSSSTSALADTLRRGKADPDPDPPSQAHHILLTLDSHSIPASEMASSTVTVTTPMIRMSLMGSTMGVPYSWGEQASCLSCLHQYSSRPPPPTLLRAFH